MSTPVNPKPFDPATYGPWALVVGGSEGVGAEIAFRLADQGVSTVLVARKTGPLEETAEAVRAKGVECRTLSVDLTEPGATEGIAAACEQARVALVGGETAEHPGLLDPDEYDVAGAATGALMLSFGDQVYGALGEEAIASLSGVAIERFESPFNPANRDAAARAAADELAQDLPPNLRDQFGRAAALRGDSDPVAWARKTKALTRLILDPESVLRELDDQPLRRL